MKQIVITLLLCFALSAASSCTDSCRMKTIRSTGRTVSREIPVEPFHTLHTSRAVQATLVSEGDKIRIEADESLIDHITVEQENGTLTLSVAPGIRFRNACIRVSVPTDGRIEEMEAASSSNILSEVPLTAPEIKLRATSSAGIVAAVTAGKCRFEATSSADIHAGVRADTCSFRATSSAKITAAAIALFCEVKGTSSADITLSGEADECRAQCTSSADFEAGEFIVKRYDIKASSSADAEIHCTEQLDARVSSSGSIGYTGECSTDARASSGGRINKN